MRNGEGKHRFQLPHGVSLPATALAVTFCDRFPCFCGQNRATYHDRNNEPYFGCHADKLCESLDTPHRHHGEDLVAFFRALTVRFGKCSLICAQFMVPCVSTRHPRSESLVRGSDPTPEIPVCARPLLLDVEQTSHEPANGISRIVPLPTIPETVEAVAQLAARLKSQRRFIPSNRTLS